MSSNTTNQPHCVHTDGTPRPSSATTAAEAFCLCMERHVLQNGINRIAAEEASLHRVEQAAARLLREEGGAADAVRARIERAAAVLRRARAAWRGGRELTDVIGAEPSATPIAVGQEEDNDAEGEDDGASNNPQDDKTC